MIDVHVEPLQGDWMAAVAAPVRAGAVRLAWLGQAGFAVRWGGWLGFIDPYISDSLRRKYAGTDKPHDRLMSPPVAAEAVRGVNAVLATHAHSDHLDPGTLPAVARNNPACRFVVPKAERQAALDRGCPEPSLVLLDAGDRVALADGVSVEAIPAAHEELTVNDRGEQVHLGYILRIGPFTLYHSGDCAPYVGLAERVAAAAPDLALLPVNGRDAARLSKASSAISRSRRPSRCAGRPASPSWSRTTGACSGTTRSIPRNSGSRSPGSTLPSESICRTRRTRCGWRKELGHEQQ